MFFWILFVVAFCGVYYYFLWQKMQKTKAQAEKFLADHPDASKVRLQTGLKGIGYETTSVYFVDGEEPVRIVEGLKQGLLLTPGKHVLDVGYGWQRPGILHKNVTTTYEPSKQEVEVEPRRIYRLGFDRDAEQYTFVDITGEG